MISSSASSSVTQALLRGALPIEQPTATVVPHIAQLAPFLPVAGSAQKPETEEEQAGHRLTKFVQSQAQSQIRQLCRKQKVLTDLLPAV